MKLLSKDVLMEFGFKENKGKSSENCTVMTKDNFDVAIKTDGFCFYSNMGFDYPLKDVTALKKLYKEVRSQELK